MLTHLIINSTAELPVPSAAVVEFTVVNRLAFLGEADYCPPLTAATVDFARRTTGGTVHRAALSGIRHRKLDIFR